jgi:sec-independent protein translocase protein TatB
VHQTTSEFDKTWESAAAGLTGSDSSSNQWTPPPPAYKHPGKRWRLKRGATPQWYKQRQGIRVRAQSGAARVARFRPPRAPAAS